MPPRLTAWIGAALVLVLATAHAHAATYYVDPQSGSDTNDGSSTGTTWETIPGTRTKDNTAFLRTQWGTVSQSKKIACGDTVLLRGGATHSVATVTNGGAVRIDPSYYANTCTAQSPITIEVATSGQWSGSSGAFTIDGTGMLVTSVNYQNADGTCKSGGYCGLVAIENLDGIIFTGLSDAQRIVLTNVQASGIAGAKTSGLIVQGKGPTVGKHIQLGWLDISNKSAYDNGYGIDITELGLSWVHDVKIHDWAGGGVETSLQTTWHKVHGLTLENVSVTSAGNRSLLSYPVSDGFYFAGAEFDDARGSGGLWCLNCTSGDNFADGLNAYGSNSAGGPGQNTDGLTRLRDSAFFGNGRNTALALPGAGALVGYGMESAGDDGDPLLNGSRNALPEQTIVSIRTRYYNNRLGGLQMPHGCGSRYSWHDTFFRAGGGENYTQAIMIELPADSMGLYNTIVDNGSSGMPITFGIAGGGRAEDANKTAPVFMNTLVRGSSASRQISHFMTRCTPDNGVTWGAPCANGGCSGNETCRTDYDPAHINCGSCPGQTVGDTPGFLVGHGNVVGTQSTQFVSTGGSCDTVYTEHCVGGSSNATTCSTDLQCPGGRCYGDPVASKFAACDLRLQSNSPAIDPPNALYVLRAVGSGNGSSTISVKAGTPEPEQVQNPPISGSNYATIGGGLNWGARPHIGDPRTYFVGPQMHPWAKGDIIQIVGSCTNGAARYGAVGRAQIVSMTSNSITVNDTCTWADGAGVHWPWNGNGPDMGAFEFGLGGPGAISAPTLLSVDPVQP